jgi:hypothetical protein
LGVIQPRLALIRDCNFEEKLKQTAQSVSFLQNLFCFFIFVINWLTKIRRTDG